MIFILDSLYVIYYIYQFIYVEPSLQPLDETKLVMVYNIFSKLLNFVCKYFVWDFCISMFIKVCFLKVSFC